MYILITGGTGFLGHSLCQCLLAANHQVTVISRQPQQIFTRYSGRVRALPSLEDLLVSDSFDAVINLAGASLIDQAWTSQRKRELYASRVHLTEALVDWLQHVQDKPKVLLSMSTIGWYGNQDETMLDEDSFYQDSYLHQLCADWERAALTAESLGIRVCVMRTGIVLGREGGILKRLLPVFAFNMGGYAGNGKQWLSWIALHDWVTAIAFLLETPSTKGVFNLTSPQPATHADFADTLARHLHRRAYLQIPAMAIRLVMGEMSSLALDSQRCLPSRLLQAGFSFRTPALTKALAFELQVPHSH